jgi:hypothetical protein
VAGKIQIRRDLRSALPGSLALGEFFFCTDTKEVFAGNGSSVVKAVADPGAITESQVTGLVSDLAATEKTANKGTASGYASLDSGGKVPTAQIPAIAESGVTNLVSDLALAAPKHVTVNSQGGNYTLVLADDSAYVRMTSASANNLTVPANSSVAFPVGTSIAVRQAGAGVTTLVAGGGVTLNNPGSALTISKQNGTVQLIKVATDTWDLLGDLTGA